MKLRRTTPFRLLALSLLRCASLMVPGQQRAEWWNEWRSELWHVRQKLTPERGISWAGEHEVALFCLGAFKDASCFREPFSLRYIPLATTRGSARQCILLLALLAALSSGAGYFFPAVRASLRPSQYRDAQHLMLIQDAGYGVPMLRMIPAEEFQIWTKQQQRVFDEFAFYSVHQEALSGSSLNQETVGVAHASSNLFALLGLPIRFAATHADPRNLPRLILSDELWKKQFGGDTHIVGHIVRLGQHEAFIAGIAPNAPWELPGKVQAWLLVPNEGLATESKGFAIAHLRFVGFSRGDLWSLSLPTLKGSADNFLCISLSSRARIPWNAFLLAVFLACMALPATTSLPLGEYRVRAKSLSWATILRRWSFLSSKIILLLPIVCFVPLGLTHLIHPFIRIPPENIQIVASFLLCLFGLRWALRDQRQRCPLCLGLLTHPARVGQPSRNFLSWNGTELICAGGHGLMHIPEIATSWFGTQRWLHLDSSWQELFANPGLASSGFF